MSWLQEGIQAIVALTREAKQVTIKEATPRDMVVVADGEIKVVPHPVPPRDHEVTTLESLIDAAKSLCSVEGPVVWHDETAIVAILNDKDDGDRLDKVTLNLSFTYDFQTLLKLTEATVRYSQENFIRLLRYTFCVDPAVVNKFRRLDWAGKTSATGTVTQGASRMGKAIEAEVLGIDDLPETIRIQTVIFDQDLNLVDEVVECWVDIDAHQNTLALVPDQESLREARISMAARIHDALLKGLGEDAAVYHGRP